jgi:ABC-type Fe3+/spermidine/putrescine transport system ATPase subunit
MLIGDMDPEMFHQPDLHFSVNTAPGMPSTGKNLRRARIGRGRSTQTFAKSAILSDMKSTAADDFAIEFRDVSYTSPTGQQVLSGLNLGVRRGQTLVLLGRSGSGKTTTLKLVNRLLSPTGGEVRVNGQAGGDVIRLRRSIGYVIQDVGLFPHFTVERNIALVPTIEGWPEERIRARVRDLLQIVGLEASMASRYPRQLSGGQRQRVGVARPFF